MSKPIVTVGDQQHELLAADWSDAEVAAQVRMLMRSQFNHEAICTIARDRILFLSQELARLRKIVDAAGVCPGHVASHEDGKVCARCGIHIDDLRPPDMD